MKQLIALMLTAVVSFILTAACSRETMHSSTMDKPSMKTETLNDQSMTNMPSVSTDTIHAKNVETETKPMHEAPIMHTHMQ